MGLRAQVKKMTIMDAAERLSCEDEHRTPHISLFVSVVGDFTSIISVSQTATVAELLVMMCNKLNVSLPKYSISFGGERLQDFQATLEELDIQTEAVLQLVPIDPLEESIVDDVCRVLTD